MSDKNVWKADGEQCVCTMCGKVMDELDVQEHFGFNYYIGYGSRYDLEHVKAQFCCDCFDNLLEELESRCKTSPFVGGYTTDPDDDYAEARCAYLIEH